MTKALWIAIAAAAASPPTAVLAMSTPMACEAVGGAKPASVYPTFCSIPRTPRDVRSPAAFKAAVVEIRLAGKHLARETAPGTFELPIGDADAFSRSARAEVAPPAAALAPLQPDTGTFASDARREASPPLKVRR